MRNLEVILLKNCWPGTNKTVIKVSTFILIYTQGRHFNFFKCMLTRRQANII